MICTFKQASSQAVKQGDIHLFKRDIIRFLKWKSIIVNNSLNPGRKRCYLRIGESPGMELVIKVQVRGILDQLT